MALTDNLISYWKLDETSGTRYDSKGSNDLTDNNSVLYGTGKIGNAADFEASNSEYLSHADSVSLSFGNEDFTVAGWVKLESTVYGAIASKWDSHLFDREYMLWYDDLRFKFGISSDGANQGHAVSDNLGDVALDTWYYVVGWHDATANKIYIQVNNGTVDETAWTTGCNDNTSPFKLGLFSTTSFLDGLVDEVGIWGRVLTSDERTDLYNSGDGLAYPFTGATFTPKMFWM